MKSAARSQTGAAEEGSRDRPSPTAAQTEPRRIPWVIILTLPVLIIVMIISIGIFGVLVRLFGA